MNADGSKGRTVVSDIDCSTQNISWSPDGKWLTFNKDGNIWRAESNGRKVLKITTNGGWEPLIGLVPAGCALNSPFKCLNEVIHLW